MNNHCSIAGNLAQKFVQVLLELLPAHASIVTDKSHQAPFFEAESFLTTREPARGLQ